MRDKLLVTCFLLGALSCSQAASATGPLRVHPANPRYFTDGTTNADGTLRAVYLAGSHTWSNLIDRGPADPPPKFDFDWYLKFLEDHHHNFIRLWSRHITWYQHYGERELHAAPLAWQRSGPGKALDGKPRFDLSKHDPAYFQRLRARVVAAAARGIYVSIMLFGGHQETGPNWSGNPLHRQNNINGIDGDLDGDGSGAETQNLDKIPPEVARIQKAYVREVLEVVAELDNVLFEISNESHGNSKDWQYDLIRFIHREQKSRARQHPVGMTTADWSPSENRQHLDASPADWVSYYFQAKPDQGHEAYDVNNPFPATGGKVSLQDSDHWWVEAIRGNPQFGQAWVWKSFCRGHNPILMEHLPPMSAVLKDLPFDFRDAGYVASRRALGLTRKVAQRITLARMTPAPAVASTGFCLADPGREYLVYQPRSGELFHVELRDETFTVEWMDVETGSVTSARSLKVTNAGKQPFVPPTSSDAVLYLRRSRQ